MSFDVDIAVTRGGREIACRMATGAGITALCGPSGAGKTSVLLAIAGLLRPGRGRVAVGEHVLFDAARGIDLPPERRACGVVFQDLRLFPHLSVRDNLRYGLARAPAARRWLSPEAAAGFLGIGDLLGRAPRTLSGGEAQRVAIGRALLSGPRCLLMDEPLTALDGERREGIMRLIERVRDELGLPILLVSHQRAEVDRLADSVIELA